MRQYKSSLLSCKKCKNRWILWMTREIFKMWNQITVEDCISFPVNLWWFRLSSFAQPRQKDCRVTRGINLEYRKTLLGYQFSTFDSSQNHYLGIHRSTTPSATGTIPVYIGTETLVARDEDQNRGTIPMPTFARRPSIMSSFFPVDIPQNSMVGKQRQQISELPVLLFHRVLCRGSNKWRWLMHWRNWSPRDQFMERICEILRCWTRRLLVLWTRSSQIVTSRRRSASRNTKPRKRTGSHEEDGSLSWSSTTFEWLMLMTQYWTTQIDSLSLFKMTMIRKSILDGRKFYLSLSKIPSDDVLETKFYYRWQKFHPMKPWKVCANWGFVSLINSKPYWNCTTWRSIRRYRFPTIKNCRPWWKKYRSETPFTKLWRQARENLNRWSGQTSDGLKWRWKEEEVFVTSGKRKGQCSKGDQCSFWYESVDRAPQPTPKAATPSEPSFSRGRSVSRKWSIRGKSNPGMILRQPCKYFLKGTCSRSPCESWHPTECQFYMTESGCKAGNKCLFPHFKVEEQPSKMPHKELANEEKAKTKVL